MYSKAFGVICSTLLSGTAVAMSAPVSADLLLDICRAPTLEEAARLGDGLGWSRQTDAETQEWRTSFNAYNGGSVNVVGWRSGEADDAQILAYWVSDGPNVHTACAYSAPSADSLLDALRERLGPPDSLEHHEELEMTSAWWTRGSLAYSFNQVGSRLGFTVGPAE